MTGWLWTWLAPFLAEMGRKTRRTWARLYLRGLLGPGDRKSLQPMAARLGLMLRKGTLVDATRAAATRNPPPIGAGAGASRPRERAASWTRKNGRSHFGYKAHVGLDAGSGLVRTAILTGAKVYESEVADVLIAWDEQAVYGDKAYPKTARRAPVEGIFSPFERFYRFARTRCLTLARNAADLLATLTIMNLKRSPILIGPSRTA